MGLFIFVYFCQLCVVVTMFVADIMIQDNKPAFPTKKSLILNLIPFYYTVKMIKHIKTMD